MVLCTTSKICPDPVVHTIPSGLIQLFSELRKTKGKPTIGGIVMYLVMTTFERNLCSAPKPEKRNEPDVISLISGIQYMPLNTRSSVVLIAVGQANP